VGIGFLLNERVDGPEPLEIRTDGAPASANEEIGVYVTGAVVSPGIYMLQQGDRVANAVEAAGGPAEDADLIGVNMARRLRDEDQIVVPRLGESASAPAAAQQRININIAPIELLDTLPGIGEVRAQRIADSRTTDGPFLNAQELVERELIPASVYEQIADLITVGQ
jgi:competence protein ComEA